MILWFNSVVVLMLVVFVYCVVSYAFAVWGFRWCIVCGFWFDLLCVIAVSGLRGCFGFGLELLCLDLLGNACLFAVDLWLRSCWVFGIYCVLYIMMLV